MPPNVPAVNIMSDDPPPTPLRVASHVEPILGIVLALQVDRANRTPSRKFAPDADRALLCPSLHSVPVTDLNRYAFHLLEAISLDPAHPLPPNLLEIAIDASLLISFSNLP